MTTTPLSLTLPQELLDEQKALLARIAKCREKLNIAMQRARVALSLEDTAEVFFAEMVPWAQRGGASLRSAVIRPSTTRLTAVSQTSGSLGPIRPIPSTAEAVTPAATAAAPTSAKTTLTFATAEAANEETAIAFFQNIPWDLGGGGGTLSGRSRWSSIGASELLRVATESAIRASKSKN
jgi:hypothetical protein